MKKCFLSMARNMSNSLNKLLHIFSFFVQLASIYLKVYWHKAYIYYKDIKNQGAEQKISKSFKGPSLAHDNSNIKQTTSLNLPLFSCKTINIDIMQNNLQTNLCSNHTVPSKKIPNNTINMQIQFTVNPLIICLFLGRKLLIVKSPTYKFH